MKIQQWICGVDEAGRGALAGPVCAAAVIMPMDLVLDGVTDSKLLPQEKRKTLYATITQHPRIEWAVAMAPVEIIERINILQATVYAMHKALDRLGSRINEVHDLVIDGNYFRSATYLNARTLVKGDLLIPAVSAASIIAKVTRDRWMRDIAHTRYPEYGFNSHVGYGTKVHRHNIQTFGASEFHRPSFLKNIITSAHQVAMF